MAREAEPVETRVIRGVLAIVVTLDSVEDGRGGLLQFLHPDGIARLDGVVRRDTDVVRAGLAS